MTQDIASSAERLEKYGRTKNIHIVNEIVDHGLCVRCGACEPACPVDIIRFDDEALPYITDEQECLFGCVRCLKICPGEHIDTDALDAKMFGATPSVKSVSGIIKRHLVTHSTDKVLRKEATSGGFVTQFLMHQMDTGFIDGALVLGSETGSDGWIEKPFIARTREELRDSIKSKYRLVPYLKCLEEIERVEGRYAVVGLPCHLHAIHKYVKATRKLENRIVLLVGLFCNVAFDPRVYDEVCEVNGLTRGDVKHLDFRAGHWPGTILATLQDGQQAKVLNVDEMRDEFNMLKLFYAPNRCNMCIDFGAEYADVAVGDPWLRDRPDGEFAYPEGWTSIVTRTELGDRLVQEAMDAGVIGATESSIKNYMVNWDRAAKYKREFVPNNIRLHKALGFRVPKYYRDLPETSFKSKIRAFIFFISYRLAHFKIYRMWGLRFFQSKFAVQLFRRKRGKKAVEFLSDLPRMEKFYEANKPPPPKPAAELEKIKLKFRNEY